MTRFEVAKELVVGATAFGAGALVTMAWRNAIPQSNLVMKVAFHLGAWGLGSAAGDAAGDSVARTFDSVRDLVRELKDPKPE